MSVAGLLKRRAGLPIGGFSGLSRDSTRTLDELELSRLPPTRAGAGRDVSVRSQPGGP